MTSRKRAAAPATTRIATAGWNVPKTVASAFVGAGSHLQRYGAGMNAAEIDSSFHRPHRRSTYARWAAETPDGFRFAVKLPKTVTHERRLLDIDEPLTRFVDEVGGLAEKLGVLLVQLPPSLAFEHAVAGPFFDRLHALCDRAIVVEPRHASWFDDEADAVLRDFRIGRVAADPAKWPRAATPGGWLGPHGDGRGAVLYWRWHGAPRTYWSAYDDEWLRRQAAAVAAWPTDADTWCVFDNTASGAALPDALRFSDFLKAARAARRPR